MQDHSDTTPVECDFDTSGQVDPRDLFTLEIEGATRAVLILMVVEHEDTTWALLHPWPAEQPEPSLWYARCELDDHGDVTALFPTTEAQTPAEVLTRMAQALDDVDLTSPEVDA